MLASDGEAYAVQTESKWNGVTFWLPIQIRSDYLINHNNWKCNMVKNR